MHGAASPIEYFSAAGVAEAVAAPVEGETEREKKKWEEARKTFFGNYGGLSARGLGRNCFAMGEKFLPPLSGFFEGIFLWGLTGSGRVCL